MAELSILSVLFKVILSISFFLSDGFNCCKKLAFCEILKEINSTMITAPSMIIPKSMAPKLIKLASILKTYIIDKVKSKLNGMIEAITSPERILPNNNTTMKITIKLPKIKFSSTVKVVLPIKSLLSKKPLI